MTTKTAKDQQQEYSRQWEWNGFDIHGAPSGWVVESWSCIQGRPTGRKVLVPYSERYPRDCRLDQVGAYGGVTAGDILAHTAEDIPGTRVLRHGHEVR